MKTGRDTFRKYERLRGFTTISALFKDGNVLYTRLLRIVWKTDPSPGSCRARVLFSVSKKNFRLAVTRNIIRRRMREAYRRNKHPLYDCLTEQNTGIVFAVIYKETHLPEYSEIEISIKEMIEKFIIQLKETRK